MGRIAQIFVLHILFVAVANSTRLFLRHDGQLQPDLLYPKKIEESVRKESEERVRKPYISNDEDLVQKGLDSGSVPKDAKIIDTEKAVLDRVKTNGRRPSDTKLSVANKDETDTKIAKDKSLETLRIEDVNEKKTQLDTTPASNMDAIVFRDSEEVTTITPPKVNIPETSVNNTVDNKNVTDKVNPNVTGRFGEFLVFIPNANVEESNRIQNQNELVPLSDTNINQATQAIPINFVPVQNVQSSNGGIPVIFNPNTNTIQNVPISNLQPVQNLQTVQNVQSLQPVQNVQSLQSLQPVHNVQGVPVQNLLSAQNLQPVQNLQNVQTVQYVPVTLLPNNGNSLYTIIQLPIQNVQAQNPNVIYVNNLPNSYQSSNVPFYSLVPLNNVNGNYISVPNNINNLG